MNSATTTETDSYCEGCEDDCPEADLTYFETFRPTWEEPGDGLMLCPACFERAEEPADYEEY